MEANGHARWFERPLAELTFALWIGARIQASVTSVTPALKRASHSPLSIA